MIDKDLVKRYILRVQKQIPKNVKPRELRVQTVPNKALCIIGPRRAGKTYYLFSLVSGSKNYLYIDFENPVFYDLSPKDAIALLDTYRELYPEIERPMVILDEVQVVQDWERMVRYFLTEASEVYVTGSSSKLLSKEIATALRGRALSYVLLPLSFREFLTFKNVAFKGRDLYINYHKIKALLNEYLNYGSYPEVVLNEPKERILQEYLDLIIKKDLLERYRIKNVRLINEIIYFSINNYAKYLSYDSLFRLYSQRFHVTKRTIINYLSYFEDIFFMFLVKRYSGSIKTRIVSPRKIYLIDVGFGLFGHKDISRDMENIVFLELLRRKYYENVLQEIFYYQDSQGHEIDFLIKEGSNVKELIQVTYASSFDEIASREYRALIKALELFKGAKLTIVTWDYEDSKLVKWFGKEVLINFVPLWKWLLRL